MMGMMRGIVQVSAIAEHLIDISFTVLLSAVKGNKVFVIMMLMTSILV